MCSHVIKFHFVGYYIYIYISTFSSSHPWVVWDYDINQLATRFFNFRVHVMLVDLILSIYAWKSNVEYTSVIDLDGYRWPPTFSSWLKTVF